MSDLCDKLETATHVQNHKYGLEVLGVNAGPPRPPLLPIGQEDRESIRAMLNQIFKVPV